MFEDAITDELAEINPWQGAKVRDDDRRATKRARRLRVFTFEQLHDLAALASYRRSYVPKARKPAPVAAPAPVYEPMLRTLADCGLRIGELFALQRSDLDIQAGLITVGGMAWEGCVTGSKRGEEPGAPDPGTARLSGAAAGDADSDRHAWLFPTPTGKLWRYSNWHRKVATHLRAGKD
jgi:integrase